ncbi:MAG TPA: acetylxylan esterase [Ohtaekwangia sp.]|nr:acetylxylan esterase [Ohtaekwangia sp.]
MKLVFTLLLYFVVVQSLAQNDYDVLDWKSEQSVNTFLSLKMHQQFDQRRLKLEAALASSEGVRAYRDSCKVRYKKLIGRLPPKTDLNARIEGVIRQDGYRIEKILYESIPDHHVTANLYVPEGKGPFPGVLLFCGHEDEAKATASYQRTASLFAKNGFVVFVIDPISQSERHQLTDEKGKALTRGGTTEHTLVNAAANLVGSGTVAYQLWDNIRGLDYLENRKEVDKERIGCLGNSGGGTQTMYLMAYDDRIKVAAPCSFIASRKRNFDLFGPNDGCQHLPFEGREQLEMADFLIMFAPKPVLILAGRYDFIDYTGTLTAYNELHAAYNVLNVSERVNIFTVNDGHGISKPKREAAVSWFRRWLYQDEKKIIERDAPVLSPQVLAVTPALSINGNFKNEVNDLDRTEIVADRLKENREVGNLHEKIKMLFQLQDRKDSISVESPGSLLKDGVKIDKYIIRKGNGIPLPALVVYPVDDVDEVVLWLSEKGKGQIADSVSLIRKFINENKAVIMADVSGVGELRDATRANDPKYFNEEYRNAMLALHVGDNVVAMRTRDVVNVLEFFGSLKSLKGKPLTVLADGVCTLPALHAAVVDDRITRLQLYGGPESFYEIIDKPIQPNWYSYVIPGVLQYYDIPDLKHSLGPRLIK